MGLKSTARAQARAQYAEVAETALASWEVVERMANWKDLLLGNGASMAVWAPFGYDSLYEAAAKDRQQPLTVEDIAVFSALKTRNFEAVLRSLRTSTTVARALGFTPDPFNARYASTRDALVHAVRAVHIPYDRLKAQILTEIRDYALAFEKVFTTNYDLLLYWALMEDSTEKPRDYFWPEGRLFDVNDTDYPGGTHMFHLHGGLHLVRLRNGRTHKRTAAAEGQGLLDLFGTPVPKHPAAVPLFVSEGSAEEKLAAIRTSDYLSFALRNFDSRSDDPIVVFGHGLTEQDEHIVKALRRRTGPIAVSVRASGGFGEAAAKVQIRARLHRGVKEDLWFFDAGTSPFGPAHFRMT